MIGGGSAVVGRDAERAVLRSFLAARTGPAALVLDGEAGIGKSTLWEEALQDAARSGCRVLRCRPAPAESQLAFAALADLLGGRRLADVVHTLAPPQRRALEAALLREESDAAAQDVRAIAGGLLAVLRHLAAAQPVVLAIDDVQWLDAPSRAVLEFAARRASDDQVAVLVARRSPGGEELPLGLTTAFGADRTTRLTLAPMSHGELHQLLESRLELSVSRPVLRRLRELSGGNPFYALQLALALDRGGDVEGELPATLGGVVLARLAALPEPVLELLLRIALLYDRRTDVVLTLVREDGLDGSLDAAIEAGVLEEAGDRLAFTHPLLASAVHSRIGPERASALHRRLAEVETTGEARALHLALAAGGPDAATADELEIAAGRAARRGAAETAARLAEHAARLTPRDAAALAARRTVAAAEHHAAAGDPRRAYALTADLVDRLDAGPERAEALSLLSWLHTSSAHFGESVRVGERAIAEAGDDVRLIAVTRQRLSTAERIRGELDASEAHARAAVEGARQIADVAVEALSLASLGLTRLLRGAGVGPELRHAAALERRLPEFLGQQAPSLRLGLALLVTDDYDEARRVFADSHDRALASGHEDARAMILSYRSTIERRAGDWARARTLADAARELARQACSEQEQNAGAANLALLEVGLGNEEVGRAQAVAGLDTARRMGDRAYDVAFRGVLGFLELSLDDPAAAARWLAPATDELLRQGIVELGFHPEIVHNEIEALVALGERDRAVHLTDHLERLAVRNPRPWMSATAARSRALLLAADGDLDAAREQLRVAISGHERSGQPLELARTLTLVGALERRAKQRRAAREALERAIGLLDALPAPLWAARAHAELARLGQRATPSELSATEARIAALAAEGRSNPEIAAAVFVSRKTVEANLSKIYRKLGVRSRVELARHLARR